MTIIGNPRSFHKRFKFIVEIDDIGHAGFQKCFELSVEVANVQYFVSLQQPCVTEARQQGDSLLVGRGV